MAKREERAPNVGDEAPDFELPLLHGDGKTVRLLDLRGRPVALIFGSYT
jgi:peroxiredoxin